MRSRTPQIFCALDTTDLDQAVTWARQIGPVTGGLKIGLEFFNAFGPQGVEAVAQACPEADLFLDMKYHDIPNTVGGAVRALCAHFAPAYINVHAGGGLEMMQAAREASGPSTKVLGVTLLTSLDQGGADQIGFAGELTDTVLRLARLGKQAGLDGVVCSAHEISLLRADCGEDFVLMVPGIRPAGSDPDDQRRVVTPGEALSAGASHLVIGRPITRSPDPIKAARAILDGLS